MPSLLPTLFRTLFYRTLLTCALVAVASAAQAAPIDTGSLFENGKRHLRYGPEERPLRDEVRVADGRFSGRASGRFLARAPRGEVAVPEPGAALLFGLGALAVARSRRRSG
jgi:hypothetical protein